MTDIIDIKDLAKSFKNENELKEYSNKQFIALKKAAKRITELEEEVNHLKNLLTNGLSLINENPVEKIIVSPEEALCEAQIRLLHDRALQRELTLEETKKLDLLIKNKRLLSGQSTAIAAQSKKIDSKNFSSEYLVQIAKKPTEEEIQEKNNS